MTKVYVFEGLFDGAVHGYGKDIAISVNLTYLGRVVHNDGGLSQEVIQ